MFLSIKRIMYSFFCVCFSAQSDYCCFKITHKIPFKNKPNSNNHKTDEGDDEKNEKKTKTHILQR